MRGNYQSLKGINLTVLEKMHQFVMGGGGTGGAAQPVRGNYKSFKGINLAVKYILHVNAVGEKQLKRKQTTNL